MVMYSKVIYKCWVRGFMISSQFPLVGGGDLIPQLAITVGDTPSGSYTLSRPEYVERPPILANTLGVVFIYLSSQ